MRTWHLYSVVFILSGAATGCGSGETGETTSPSGGSGPGGSGGQTSVSSGGAVEIGSGGSENASGGEGPAAGSGGEPSEGPAAWVTEPTFGQNPNPAVPQAGVLSFETDVASAATVTVTGGDEEWELSLAAGTDFKKEIVGLLPDTEYSVRVSATAGDNILTAGPLLWKTPPLPPNLPPVEAVLTESDKMEPGMTMFNVRAGAQEPMLIVDHQGRVRWYYVGAPVHSDQTRLKNGNFLFDSGDYCWIQEVTILGDSVRSWKATEGPTSCGAPEGSIPVAVESFHHDIGMLDSGNLLGTSTETRFVDNFPASETNASLTETRLVMGGVVIEFTPEGVVEKRIHLLDVLDPTRIGRDSLGTLFGLQGDYARELGEVPADWDHLNSVAYDEATDGYIISMRNQDAVIKIDRQSEELVWILGNPGNWGEAWANKLLTPIGDNFQWQYHQHAPDIFPSGIAMYDNGNYRAPAFETAQQPEFSRAVIFSVDDAAMTVSQVWSYGEPEGVNSFFSPFMGDADVQPVTGNMLVANGQFQKSGGGGSFGSIFEVTPDGTRVFELVVGNQNDNSSLSIYRADRIADIRK